MVSALRVVADGDELAENEWEEPPRKRQRANSAGEHLAAAAHADRVYQHEQRHTVTYGKDKAAAAAPVSKLAPHAVTPFLARHVPSQYAPLGPRANDEEADAQTQMQPHSKPQPDPNSKYCYRHRPDMLCRKQADEPSMEALQKDLEAMPHEDRQGIVQVWSLYSAAPAKHRKLMLQGILAQCCFPQLSYLSASVRELIKIDFLAALPAEVSYRILCFLDTAALCKAAQVSRRWRQLADDDVVWHRMCEQHIDRKCTKCGWGLPLLERKRLRATKRQMQLRAAGRGVVDGPWPAAAAAPADHDESASPAAAGSDHGEPVQFSDDIEKSPDGRLSPVLRRPKRALEQDGTQRKTRPWKDVYKDRFRVGTNWKNGRCRIKVLKGHTNGVMALQILDHVLATGSYDASIKIWDLDTGEEMRTLRGHTMGIRCLQFDEQKLISGSLDKTIKVWNWRTGECKATYHGHSDGIISLHFNGNILASGAADNTVRVWNFSDHSSFCMKGHTDWVNSVRVDTASRTLVTASDDCTVKLWDLDSRRCIRTYEGHVGHVQQVLTLPPEFDPEVDADDEGPGPGPGANSPGNSPGSSHDPAEPHLPALPSHSLEPLSDLFPCEPARPRPPKYMLTSSLDATIRLWEVASGRCIRTYFGHVEGVWAIAADTLRMVSGAHDRTVKVWDPRSGKAEKTFAGHTGPVTCIGLSDSRMCSGGEDGDVRLYNFTD
ncbi:hypothetical protein DV737_g2189, partial [Chaetothyriales sp. CBS 132003]